MVRSLRQKWLPLESKLFELLKFRELNGSRIVVALSGGPDSVALVTALHSVSVALKLQLAVAHFHHGKSSSKRQNQFRQKSLDFCKDLSSNLSLPFFYETYLGTELKSEAEFRKARYIFFGNLIRDHKFQFLATAHHKDDLLETRLIRLIRGVGTGGLQSLTVKGEGRLRPFLDFTKEDIQIYLKQKKQKYVNDPSNQSRDPLRNWVRKSWLNDLEVKRPGSKASLARSLSLLTRRAKSEIKNLSSLVESQGINRSRLMALSLTEQRQVLALFLKKNGVESYTASQIDEVLKRLKSPRRDFLFVVAKREWQISVGYVQIRT